MKIKELTLGRLAGQIPAGLRWRGGFLPDQVAEAALSKTRWFAVCKKNSEPKSAR